MDEPGSSYIKLSASSALDTGSAKSERFLFE